MAGHARYTAVLDACVLYPVALADALISLAAVGVFAAKWTTLIESCQWSSNNPHLWSSNFPHPSTPRSEGWQWKTD
jgi:hypothetical protein